MTQLNRAAATDSQAHTSSTVRFRFYVVGSGQRDLVHANAGIRVHCASWTGGHEPLQKLMVQAGSGAGPVGRAGIPVRGDGNRDAGDGAAFTDGLFEVEAQDGSLYDYKDLRYAVGNWPVSRQRISVRALLKKSASFRPAGVQR